MILNATAEIMNLLNTKKNTKMFDNPEIARFMDCAGEKPNSKGIPAIDK